MKGGGVSGGGAGASAFGGGTLVPGKCATDYYVRSSLKNTHNASHTDDRPTSIYHERTMRFTTLSHLYYKTTKIQFPELGLGSHIKKS